MVRRGKSKRFKLGIDIGGTFTDVVMLDESYGQIYNGKLPSTPQPSKGSSRCLNECFGLQAKHGGLMCAQNDEGHETRHP